MTSNLETIISKLSRFCKKYKSDFIALLLIIVVFSGAIHQLWGYFGSLLYDCGREAYLPQLILEGKLLYKDIFAMYNPLSYQINAVLYLLFGNNLNVLYFAGALNALIILLTSYFILRQFINSLPSTLIVFFLMFTVILNSFKTTNYIFPYAYAIVYAISTFLFSVIFCCLYIKNPKKSYNIILSFLMLGLSFANKPEFSLCIFPLFWVLYRQKEKWHTYIIAVTAFILPIVISYGALFFQGFTLHDLSEYIVFINNFFNTEEQQFFNSQVAWPYNFKTALTILFELIAFILVAGLPVLVFRLSKTKNYYKYLTIPLCILIFYLYSRLALPSVYHTDNAYLSWCCLVNFFILYFAIKKREDLLIFLTTCAIISCYRSHFILQGIYCSYMVILPFLVCMIYFVKYLDIRFVKHTDKQIASVFLFIFSIIVFGFSYHTKHVEWIKTDTYGHGTVYNWAVFVEPFNSTTDWIFGNTKTDDTIVVLPEGLLINYFTGRKTCLKYYHLIPNHISALGENNIVNDMHKNLPDYFILNNASYPSYGKGFICESFGTEICNMIFQNYELKQYYRSKYNYENSAPYQFLIYKLKNK